jgi:Icc-related predicted phosphoesterase
MKDHLSLGVTSMARGFGIKSRSAREQLKRKHPPAKPEPLPEPYAPASVEPTHLGIKDPGDGVSFFVLGDVGGVKAPGPQNAVSVAMQQLVQEGQAPAFVLIVGDVVYFNGQQMGLVEGRQTGYGDQFYEPYAKLAKPIIAFPGNHDGEPEQSESQEPAESSLQGFMENFCSPQPEIPKDDPQLEYGRHTQTLPYCEWTLPLNAATIVAVYSNVPSGGDLEPRQIERLTDELKNADPNKPLILGLHHPPYSVDSHHGGSPRMAEILDKAFEEANRIPNLILSGHVHDYQRFTHTINGKQVPYIVAGNGGYHNLHKLAKDATPGEELAEAVVFEHGDDRRYGFLKLTIKGQAGEGEYIAVTPGQMPDGSEAQVFPAEDAFKF